MAANKIIAKIEEEASKDKAAILAAAEEKANALSEKILADAKVQVAAIEQQAKADAEEAGRRQVLIAELESRKKSLASKRSVIEKAFAKAQEKLMQLPAEQWERLITAIVLAGSQTGKEQLHVPAADMDKYKNGLLAKLNAALSAQGKEGALTLSEVPAKFKGGVELEGTATDYDGSFESLLSDIRRQEEQQVAAVLFGSEVK